MEENELPPWEKFNRWIHCICVVTFDLELGQAIEVIYPGDARLSATEKMNICYLSFPDSNSSSSRDTNFHFRIRRSNSTFTDAQIRYREKASPIVQIDDLFLFGYVHFRQQKDSSMPRGYFQKSLVIVSVLPLLNLFMLMAESIATGFFEFGEAAIEAACHDIDQWPPPVPGNILYLPLMGNVVRSRIPSKMDTLSVERQIFPENESTNPACITLSTINEPDLYGSLYPIISHIQLLWELVVIGEPIMVMAPSPSICSAMVQALVSIIWPLKYMYDFRPFFTIHDSEFSKYTTKRRNIPNVILGVTNPFFSKTLQHWPHVIKLSESQTSESTSSETIIKKTWDGKILDMKPGLYTQYKPYLTRDKLLIKNILKSERPSNMQNEIIRRHMLELTHTFLIPLERFISTLMPLKKEMSPFRAIPQTRPFVVDEFLSTLTEATSHLSSEIKGDRIGFYKRFMASKNFEGWLHHRQNDINRQLQNTYLEVICNSDFSPEALQGRHQVEIVDLVLKLFARIRELDDLSEERRNRLKQQMMTIMQLVDDDLKSVLLSNRSLRDCVE